jgi:alpha-mannosidase
VPAPLVSIDHPGVQLSAVKRADDGSGDLIVRLAEVCGQRSPITVQASGRITSATRTNALEEVDPIRDEVDRFDVFDGVVVVTLQPFELVTLRLNVESTELL